MKKILGSITLLILLIFNLSCSKDPVTSEEVDNSTPGRRDYTWTVDTLKGEWHAYISGLWGSDPNDLWAVGSAGATIDAIWHFDGEKWEQKWPGISSNLMSVCGFAQNNVWAVGAPGDQIYKFDGNLWEAAATLSIPGYIPGFNQIWGDAPYSIFAVGGAESTEGKSYKGIIATFYGNVWSVLDIPDLRVGFTGIKRGIKESSNFFLSATRYEKTGDIYKIYLYDSKSLKELYSGTDLATVNEVDGQAFIVIGKKVYKYQDNKLVLWKDFSGTQFAGLMYGRSTKDFFSEGYNGLMHYNGTDIETIYPTDMGVWAMAIFPNDILFAGNKGGISIMVHGKLKQR
ncbi:MAG: hypothetical protein ACM3P0_13030 [Acidobacteriota bacterium]